jgi:epoxide hydrolase-like predicted phosphatase
VRRAVICDFGGVLTTPLIDSFMHYQESSGVSFEELGKSMQRLHERTGRHPLYELEKGAITEDQFLRSLEAEMEGDAHLGSMADTFFGHMERNDAMIDLMRSLRRRGLRMALLTNNVREWEPRWRAKLPEIDEIFEVVVDSAFVEMRKPDPAIYELTVERLGGGVTAADCVFVDDIEVNCQAARKLGMAAVRYQTSEQAIPEIEAALAQSE